MKVETELTTIIF